jgi:hypothetical protein
MALHHCVNKLQARNFLHLLKLKYSCTDKSTIFNLFGIGPMMEPPLLLLKISMVRARSCSEERDGFASLCRYVTG